MMGLAPSETVATFEVDGVQYELDHLGIANPDGQWGWFVVFRGDEQVTEFQVDGYLLKPEFRPELPDDDELIELATREIAAVDEGA
jgi:hypothetical protein